MKKIIRTLLAAVAFLLAMTMFAGAATAAGWCGSGHEQRNTSYSYSCTIGGKTYTSSSSVVSACNKAKDSIAAKYKLNKNEGESIHWADTWGTPATDEKCGRVSGQLKRYCTVNTSISYTVYKTKSHQVWQDLGGGQYKLIWAPESSKFYIDYGSGSKTITWQCKQVVPGRWG